MGLYVFVGDKIVFIKLKHVLTEEVMKKYKNRSESAFIDVAHSTPQDICESGNSLLSIRVQFNSNYRICNTIIDGNNLI